MSGISRVDKYILETAKLGSLSEATKRRTEPINIVIGMSNQQKIGVMSRTATALALRSLKGPVNVYFQDSAWRGTSLFERLQADFQREADVCDAADRLKIHYGVPREGHCLQLATTGANGISVDAHGWIASINSSNNSNLSASGPAAIFAVSCGFAKIFREIVIGNASQSKERWDFSLANFAGNQQKNALESPGPSLDLGHIALLGAGAIGSGFMFALIMSGWHASVDIIDDDRYEEVNLETTLLTSKKAVRDSIWKADHLSSMGGMNPEIECRSIKKRVLENDPELLQSRNILVCTVDNTETRRILDSANVEVILNGATGGTRLDSGHVLWSRHVRPMDPTLRELYPAEVKDELPDTTESAVPTEVAQDGCSRVAYEGVSLSAPFMGLAAGSLLLAGCVHRVIDIKQSINYLKFDLMGLQGKYRGELKTGPAPRK